MFRGHFKPLRVKSVKEAYEDAQGNGLLRRSQSEEQPKPEFGGTTSSQATMLSPLESVFTYVIPLECLKQPHFPDKGTQTGWSFDLSGSQEVKGGARNNSRVLQQIVQSGFPPKAFRQRTGGRLGSGPYLQGLVRPPGGASGRMAWGPNWADTRRQKTRLVNPQKQPQLARGLKCPHCEVVGGACGHVRPSHWSPA